MTPPHFVYLTGSSIVTTGETGIKEEIFENFCSDNAYRPNQQRKCIVCFAEMLHKAIQTEVESINRTTTGVSNCSEGGIFHPGNR